MPDLTIKPVAAAGNKLILQDQAGGAVLTTADSGATLANASLTAPTIANMANCSFPAGHLIKSKEQNMGGVYASGNVKQQNPNSNPPGAHVHADFDMTCSNIPQVSSKVIKVQYNLFVSHGNHPQYFIIHSWDNSSWVKSPRGATTGAALTYGNANSQYPHGQGGYDGDNNNTQHVQVATTWVDTTSSNTTLYTRLYWQSQNDTVNIYINRTINHGAIHGGVMNSSGSVYIYQG